VVISVGISWVLYKKLEESKGASSALSAWAADVDRRCRDLEAEAKVLLANINTIDVIDKLQRLVDAAGDLVVTLGNLGQAVLDLLGPEKIKSKHAELAGQGLLVMAGFLTAATLTLATGGAATLVAGSVGTLSLGGAGINAKATAHRHRENITGLEEQHARVLDGRAKIQALQDRLQAVLNRVQQDPEVPPAFADNPLAAFSKADRQTVRRIRNLLKPSLVQSLTVTSTALSSASSITAASMVGG
jgi:hypothetical protein